MDCTKYTLFAEKIYSGIANRFIKLTHFIKSFTKMNFSIFLDEFIAIKAAFIRRKSLIFNMIYFPVLPETAQMILSKLKLQSVIYYP